MRLKRLSGRAAITGALALLWAGPVLATTALQCVFTTECYETESCAGTEYAVTISHKEFADGQDVMDASAVWQDDVETRTVLVRQRPDVTFGMWADNDGRIFGRVLINGTGEARYIYMNHDGPFIVTYHGTCEGMD